ncbi:MAG: threonine synthase [Proteobacteria bacterium]|nr:threonine synthase [Pseudomonadota bacterium]
MKLFCRSCGETVPHDTLAFECECGGLFDLDFSPSFDPDAIARRPPDLWRYREALPVSETYRVSLGEGMTPLLRVPVSGREVLIKAEQASPTGSYKDRGAALMISKAREMGVVGVVEDSSGNAGASVAAYCAAAGIDCSIFVPDSTSPGKLAQIELYGARLTKVPGSREDTAAAVLEAAQHSYYASHSYNPYFFHGTKTWAFEVVEQLGWTAPDTVVLPAGNGTLLLGAYIGFSELLQAGMISAMPRMVAVQGAGCAPLCKAFEQGLADIAPLRPTSTLAEGIAIAEPVRGAQMLESVRETGGLFLAVEDEEITTALLSMGRRGHCIEPTSAAVVAGLLRYLDTAPPDECIVSVFTGHGLKAAGKIEHMLAER